MNDENGRLSELLQTWKVETSLPARFEEQVWRKISLEEERQAPGVPAWWTALIAGFTAALRRPAGAFAYLAALLVAGGAVGYLSSEHYARDTEMAWRTAYVHSVTPTPAFRQ